jgi:hypothetical protein
MPLIRKTQLYTKRIVHRGIWVERQLLAEIEYRAKSAERQGATSLLSGAARRHLRRIGRKVLAGCHIVSAPR